MQLCILPRQQLILTHARTYAIHVAASSWKTALFLGPVVGGAEEGGGDEEPPQQVWLELEHDYMGQLFRATLEGVGAGAVRRAWSHDQFTDYKRWLARLEGWWRGLFSVHRQELPLEELLAKFQSA